MINRRSFLNSSIWVAGFPLLGNAATSMGNSKQAVVDKNNRSFYHPNNITPKADETYYISHRGVHLKQRVAGENTIESLKLAKRVGFQCVEFDVRFTKDGKPVVIHDATINRTLRDFGGNKLKQPIHVKDLTYNQIRTEYVIYTENANAKAIVPSFEEYIDACQLYKIIPFVELKQHELSEEQYTYILNYLDKVIGRANYVITSNNKVSDKLRSFGYNDIMVMGILYQTTFEHIQSWKHSIMAISANRFTADKFNENVLLANREGILTESHTDTIDKYNTIVQNGIDFISTDALIPEYTGYGQIVELIDLEDDGEISEITTSGVLNASYIILKMGDYLEISLEKYKHFFLYGVMLEIELSGKCKCSFRDEEYDLLAKEKICFRYPVLMHKEPFTIKINAMEACDITGLRLAIIKF